jgi:hypothetical protein
LTVAVGGGGGGGGCSGTRKISATGNDDVVDWFCGKFLHVSL